MRLFDNSEFELTAETFLGASLVNQAAFAMVAGGAIRDMVLDKPVSDVDLFIRTSERGALLHPELVFWRADEDDQRIRFAGMCPRGQYCPSDNWVCISLNEVPDAAEYDVFGFMVYETPEIPGLQVIHQHKEVAGISKVATAMAVLKSFTCHLSQIGRIVSGPLVMTPEFMADLENNTITYEYTTNKAYVMKLEYKFPERVVRTQPREVPF